MSLCSWWDSEEPAVADPHINRMLCLQDHNIIRSPRIELVECVWWVNQQQRDPAAYPPTNSSRKSTHSSWRLKHQALYQPLVAISVQQPYI